MATSAAVEKHQSKAFEKWLLKAKQLRAESVEKRADFLQHLASGEDSATLWSGSGYTSFVALLDGENLCTYREYMEFRTAVSRYGFSHVRRVGAGTARKLQAVPEDAESRRCPGKPAHLAALEDLEAFRERECTTPSERNAVQIILGHYAAPKNKRPATDYARMRQLESENERLVKENEKLKAALAVAEAELERMRLELREAKRPRQGRQQGQRARA